MAGSAWLIVHGVALRPPPGLRAAQTGRPRRHAPAAFRPPRYHWVTSPHLSAITHRSPPSGWEQVRPPCRSRSSEFLTPYGGSYQWDTQHIQAQGSSVSAPSSSKSQATSRRVTTGTSLIRIHDHDWSRHCQDHCVSQHVTSPLRPCAGGPSGRPALPETITSESRRDLPAPPSFLLLQPE